jgi:hypothetical protein
MAINNELDLIIQEDELVVLGPPSTVDIAVDIGPEGVRGSSFFTGDGDPNNLSLDQFFAIHGEVPKYKDVYLRIDFGPDYGKFYSYVAVPGNDQWVPVIDLLQTMGLFFQYNDQSAATYYSFVNASAVYGSSSVIPQLRFDQDKRLVSVEDIPVNISSTQIYDFGNSLANILSDAVTSNVENGINVFYDTETSTLNFDVDDFTITLTGDVQGQGTVTNLANVSISASVQDNSHNHLSTNVTDFQEAVEDVVGAMVQDNTELGIAVTYNDTTGKLNFDVNDFSVSLIGDVIGTAVVTNLGSIAITTEVQTDSHFHSPATIVGGDEYIEDIVGAMVSGNTEAGIAVTYADNGPQGRGKLNFDVNDFTITYAGDITGTTVVTNLASTTSNLQVVDDSHNHSIATLTNFTEEVQDAAALLFNHPFHTNISVNYDDANNRIFLVGLAGEGGGGGGGGEGNIAYTWWFGV